MSNPARSLPRLIAFTFLMVARSLIAQDEVRLTDGGVLKGKIIAETPAGVDLKHKSFGVIHIPREKIVVMGPEGTLPAPGAPKGPAPAETPARSARRSTSLPGASRLDLVVAPTPVEPDPLAEDSAAGATGTDAGSEAALTALYDKLLRHETLKDEDAQVLLRLNERWQADRASMSPLEQNIVRALMGESDDTATTGGARTIAPPPAELAPVVAEIRAKLDKVTEISYQELYSVVNPLGKVAIRYDRQSRRPNLTAGRGEVLEHVDPTQNGRAVRYFSDGQSLWLLTQRGSEAGKAFVAQSVNADQMTEAERAARAEEFVRPAASRIDYSRWEASGYPVEQMARLDLLLDPFSVLDLSTLKLVSEDETQWNFSARISSPAFAPMEEAELTFLKATAYLTRMSLKGNSVQATLEISAARSDPGLPEITFRAPEAPAGQEFKFVEAPESPIQALSILGSL